MIAIVYRLRLKPGHENAYDDAWQHATRIARERFGSHGSHLFHAADGARVAIALWPTLEARDRFAAWRRENPSESGRIMRDAIDGDLGEEVLQSVHDLWTLPGASVAGHDAVPTE